MNRVDQERREHEILSPYAAFADRTRGRVREIPPDDYRTDFQRDRDRIIHSKAFRRLSHKTQVFLAPTGDHFRTRLTHTLEVAQISRSIARALRLNEDLAEAISLGHDLGHTPFGHTGEDVMSDCLARHEVPGAGERGTSPTVPGHDFEKLTDESRSLFADAYGQPPQDGRYHHNRQSLRVVDVLEKRGRGLNLTYEVRDGIICHTGNRRAVTLEGRIVATADRIAYVNHDLDDAIMAGIISESDIPESTHRLLGCNHSARISTMVSDMISTSEGTGDIAMSPVIWDAMMELRSFLHERVYRSPFVNNQAARAKGLLEALFEHYLAHPDELPAESIAIAREHPSEVAPLDVTCTALVDYLAGMTDRYAREIFSDLFVPSRAE